MQLGGAVQGITDRSSIKQSFYRSVCICGVKWCCQTMHVFVHWMMCLQWVSIQFAAVPCDSVACTCVYRCTVKTKIMFIMKFGVLWWSDHWGIRCEGWPSVHIKCVVFFFPALSSGWGIRKGAIMKVIDLIMLVLLLLRLIWTLQYKESENLQSDMQWARDNTRQLKRGQAKYAVVQPTVLFAVMTKRRKSNVFALLKRVFNHWAIEKEILWSGNIYKKKKCLEFKKTEISLRIFGTNEGLLYPTLILKQENINLFLSRIVSMYVPPPPIVN